MNGQNVEYTLNNNNLYFYQILYNLFRKGRRWSTPLVSEVYTIEEELTMACMNSFVYMYVNCQPYRKK